MPVVAAIALVYVLYTLGWQTRWMQVLALLAYESLNFRFILIQHGGNVVMTIVLVWTVFLPIGQRYSLDSLFRSLRVTDEQTPEPLDNRAWLSQLPAPHVGLAFLFFTLNFAAIYFFNALHKSGGTWHDGSAVHYVLWQNRIATALDGFVRMHEPFWFSPAATWGTLFVEWTMPFLILTPWLQRPARTFAFVNCWGLHGGIALLSTLGPFSFAMMAFGVLMIQGRDFDWAAAKLKRKRWERVVRFDPAVPRQLLGARVLARLDLLRNLRFEKAQALEVVTPDGKTQTGLAAWAKAVEALPLGPLVGWLFSVVFVGDALRGALRLAARWYLEGDRSGAPAAEGPIHRRLRLAVQIVLPSIVFVPVVSQLLLENRGVPAALRVTDRPQILNDFIGYTQLRQGWAMFAPDAPLEDSLMVVDATLADGTHLDLLTGEPPDFDAPNHGPFYMSQHWCEVHQRMPAWPQHWHNFKDFLFRIPRARGWPPAKHVVSLEVWQLIARVPDYGSTTYTDIRKNKLFDQNI